MSRHEPIRMGLRLVVLLSCLSTLSLYPAVYAQAGDDIAALKRQAASLMKASKFTEALPLLEKIAAAEPDNAEIQFDLGSALIGQAANTKDNAARKALRTRARNAYIRSRELGVKEPIVDGMIQGLPVDGSDAEPFSPQLEANALMTEAEALFSQGKLDEALTRYQKALKLDPKLYFAALFSGDVFMEKGDFEHAEFWYQKAIAINPNKETAYRYSATPLMKQGKTTLARDRYIEAYITEPYSNFASSGLIRWAQITKTSIGHPKLEIPTNITFDEKGNAKINLDINMLSAKDGSAAWIAYGTSRNAWRKEKFANTFPNEKTYRHSLAEEADALRTVITMATADKPKELNPSLAALKKMNDEGLLEAYILLARADEGIARDLPAYLQQSRDKLRRYVLIYVVTAGGN